MKPCPSHEGQGFFNNIVDDNLAVGAADNGPDDGYTLILGDGATTSANVNNVNISGSSFVNY
nr:hypothetical protein [Xylophilus sp.]